jgi:hypothetical protein
LPGRPPEFAALVEEAEPVVLANIGFRVAHRTEPYSSNSIELSEWWDETSHQLPGVFLEPAKIALSTTQSSSTRATNAIQRASWKPLKTNT